MKKQFNNFVEVERMLQFLDIQEVTTERQRKNGTREFKLPMKDQYGGEMHVATFASGYIRRTKAGGYCPSWQLNKTKKNFEKEWPNGYKYYSTERILIPNEQDRLEYLISFCLKNYYIGQANMLSSGKFVAKWKYDEAIKLGQEEVKRTKELHVWQEDPEVKVIVNGHRYNII